MAHAAAIALVAVAASRVEAQPATTLAWSAESVCLDREAFARAIESATEEPIAIATSPLDATVRIAIRRRVDPPGFVASVEIGRDQATRRREIDIDGIDCRRIHDALVVVVSVLLLDEVARARPDQHAAALHVPPPDEIATRDVSVATRLLARARVDVLPGISGGMGLQAEASFGSLSIFFGSWSWPPVEARVDGAGGRFTAWSAELGACGRTLVATGIELGGCGSVAVGAVHSIGVGLDVPSGSVELQLELDVHAVARLEIARPLSAWIAAGIAVPFFRPRYSFADVDDVRALFQPAPVAPDVVLGLELREP